MNKRLLILTLAFLLTPLAGWSDVILSLNGPATPVFVGSTFWVDVNVDVTALDDLYAYQFDLTFQDSLLNALQAEDGPFLPAADLIGSILYDLSVPGSIQYVGNSMTGSAPGATGSGLLARVQFEALTAGTATITPLNMMFLDSANLAQLNASGTSTDVVINQQTTNPVPEPGSWLLLTTAGALAAFRLRRRTRHPVV